MKQIILILLSILGLPLFSQGLIRIEIQDFTKENDSLTVSYLARVGSGAIEPSRGLRFYPEIQAGDSVLILPGVTILGKNREKALSRFDKAGTGSFIPGDIKEEALLEYNVKVPYAPWMDSARLLLQQEISGYRNKNTLVTYKLRDKVDLAARESYAADPKVAFIVPEKEEKSRKRQGVAYPFLYFPSRVSVIIPTFGRNLAELQKIDGSVREVVDNPDVNLQGLYIKGYASPEGLYTTNERLSHERVEALKNYLKNKFSLCEETFTVSSVAEDWDGLAEMVRAGDMPQKDKILEIISTIDIFAGRETALMKLDGGIPYRRMLEDMFPKLRRVEYCIDYTVKDYDLGQTLFLLDKRPGDLSQLEMYNLALSYGKDSREYERILLEIIPKYFPEDPVANGNAAAILIKNGEPAAARRYLDKAGDNGATQNNLGIICLLEGDTEKAETCFTEAQIMGNEEAATNLEALRAKLEDNQKQERRQNRK